LTIAPKPLTPAERRALQWLVDNRGMCQLDRYSYARPLAAPEEPRSSASPTTWLRLVARGYVAQGVATMSLCVTAAGRAAL